MFSVKDYCKCCQDDAYGGSIELVDAGIEAMINDANATEFDSVKAFHDKIQADVDDILAVSTSVLPLINLMIKVLDFSDKAETESDIEAVKNGYIAMLSAHREAQKKYTENIGKFGAGLIPDNAKFGTFSTSGSVMSVLTEAVNKNKKIEAVCFEARPHNEGYRTLKEISELGISTTLGVDALLCCLIPKCDVFMIGADAITVSGDVFAKTGSFPAALVCKYYGIPFYVVADTSKFDSMSVFGFPLKDSSRPPEEVTNKEFPDTANVANISFELIPAELIKGIITEKGIIPPTSISSIAKVDMSDKVIEKLGNWLNEEREM